MRLLVATTLALALAVASAQIRIVSLPGAEVALPDGVGTVSSCGSSGDHAQDVKVSLTPSNPKPGQNFTLTSSYTLDEEVTGGKAAYKAALNGVTVVDQSKDLCKTLQGSDTPCPLSKGSHSSSSTSTLPSDTPTGTFTGTVHWTDQNGEPILCLKFSFQT